MELFITSILYVALALMVIGFISGAFFYGFSTPIRAGLSIIFLLLFYNFMFLNQKETPTLETLLIYVGVSIFVLYNLKQLGILSIFLIVISTKNHHNSLSLPNNEECQTYYINTEILNLRELPNVKSNKIGFLAKNTKVCISNNEGNWSYVANQGWVAHKYLTTKEP